VSWARPGSNLPGVLPANPRPEVFLRCIVGALIDRPFLAVSGSFSIQLGNVSEGDHGLTLLNRWVERSRRRNGSCGIFWPMGEEAMGAAKQAGAVSVAAAYFPRRPPADSRRYLASSRVRSRVFLAAYSSR